MSSTHSLLPNVACLQIGQRLREADEQRLRRLARRSAHRRAWARAPR